MSEPNPDIAELKAEVAALRVAVAALFALTKNVNALGSAEHLAELAKAMAGDRENVSALIADTSHQAAVADRAFRMARGLAVSEG